MRGLVYPPVSVILVPSNRDHKGNTCSASARGVMIDRRVITIRGPVRYFWAPWAPRLSAPSISILSSPTPTVPYNS